MTKWLALGGLAVLVLALGRVLAVGRKRPQTLSEQKAKAWGGMPVRYKRTHEAKPWYLRVARRDRNRRHA